jgi:hypothetical protein
MAGLEDKEGEEMTLQVVRTDAGGFERRHRGRGAYMFNRS